MTNPVDEPFSMLNALWFKPEGGAEKYREYMRAAGPLVAQYGGSPNQMYLPQESLIGDFDADLVFFVDWPSQKDFYAFVEDPAYQAIKHLRDEALRDSLLIRCAKR